MFEILNEAEATDLVLDGVRSTHLLVGGKWQRLASPFDSERAMVDWAREIMEGQGKRLDIASPCADVYLEVGDCRYRVHAVLGSTVAERTQVSIRRHRGVAPTLVGLVAAGRLSAKTAQGIRGVLARRESFLVSGPTGAGKTTLLAAALNELAGERVIVIEDTPEISNMLPWIIGLTTRASNIEGVGAISATDLVRQTLRMRPDRVTLGEVRGAEIGAFVEALMSGHPGGGSTIHAPAIEMVGFRVQALLASAGLERESLESLPQLIPWVFHLGGPRASADIEVGHLRLSTAGRLEVERLAVSGV